MKEFRSIRSCPPWLSNLKPAPSSTPEIKAPLSFSRSIGLMIPPSSRLSQGSRPGMGQLPLILSLSVETNALHEVPSELLRAVVSSVISGVIWNRLSYEYGEVLSYWIRKDSNINVPRDLLMVKVDEVFEAVVPIFTNIAKELSIFAGEPQLITDLLRYDPIDGSIVVRISDG